MTGPEIDAAGGPAQPSAAKVGFLIAGAQKAGTTALHRFLSTHPGLFLPAKKELHFFDRPRDWSAPWRAEYDALFAGAAPGQICGEATPAYLFHPPCARRIRACNPAMRFILMLRDPVERAHSHWRMQVGRGKEPLSFSEAIRAGRARVAGNWRAYSYVERGFYGEQIARLFGLFPREQVLVLLTEDLRDRHEESLRRVWRFLGCGEAAPLPPPEEIRPLRPAQGLAPLSEEDARHLRALYPGLFTELLGMRLRAPESVVGSSC